MATAGRGTVPPRRVALITGAATGFGRAFAQAFASEGTAVMVADIDASAADRAAGELRAGGASAEAVACDVANESQVEAAVAAAVSRFGGVDILINNAGRHLLKYNQPFSVLARNDVRELFEVNVMGVVNCSVACRETMRSRGGGSIVNIASIAGHTSTTPYGVSKLAVRGLTIAFATEFAADGIRVNAVSPGLMATESAMAELPQDLVDSFVNTRQLVPRQGTMDDVTHAVAFLCSPAASFVTGETLQVSGGHPLQI